MSRVALVTGGTRGIGLGIATALAREGFDLALCGLRHPSQAAPAVDDLKATGRAVHYFRADVGERDERENLVEAVRQRFGRLHLLVNNAGVAPAERRDMLEATEESFQRVLRINLQGPYFLTQSVARWMVDQRLIDPAWQGAIVNVGSVSAEVVSINRGEYCVAKAGLAMATSLWAARLGTYAIPVYEVRPGVVETDMTAPVREKYDRLIEGGLLVEPRWGRPEDVGRAVAMLARGDLAYSTGQVINVDGGLTLRRL